MLESIKTRKKPRSDALLKTLPEERQAEIVEYMRTHSSVETSLWLKQAGLDAGRMAVSRFGCWYHLSQQAERNDAALTTVLDDLKRSDPGVTEKELDQAGQKFFSKLAIEQQDSVAWWRIQRSKIHLGMLEVARKKLLHVSRELFDEWSANEKAKALAARGELPRTKLINELGRIMFEDMWEDHPTQETKRRGKKRLRKQTAEATIDPGAGPPPAPTC